jgi:hypothetical protein
MIRGALPSAQVEITELAATATIMPRAWWPRSFAASRARPAPVVYDALGGPDGRRTSRAPSSAPQYPIDLPAMQALTGFEQG